MIINYLIHIRHTDDFPSTGTRLVTLNSHLTHNIFADAIDNLRTKDHTSNVVGV